MYTKKEVVGMAALVLWALLLLVIMVAGCQPRAEAPEIKELPSGAVYFDEFDVYRFTDGPVTCYVHTFIDRAAMSCVIIEGR